MPPQWDPWLTDFLPLAPSKRRLRKKRRRSSGAASPTTATETRPVTFRALDLTDLPSPQPLRRGPAASACCTPEQEPLITMTNHLVPAPIDSSRGRLKLTRRQRRLNGLPKPKTNMVEGALRVVAGGVVTECRGNLLQQCDGCTKRLEESVTEKYKGPANCRVSLEDSKREAAERSWEPVADMTGAEQLRIVAHEVGHSWY